MKLRRRIPRSLKGKIIGAAIGTLGGPVGMAVGALIGHLYDARDPSHRLKNLVSELSSATTRRGAPEPLPPEAEHFLSSLAGLAVAVASAGGAVKPEQIRALKSFFRDHLGFSAGGRIEEIIDDAVRRTADMHAAAGRTADIDVGLLAIRYGNLTPFGGRLLLLRVLFMVVQADPEGINSAEERLILRIAGLLGLESYYPGIRAEFSPADTGRAKAYRILGVAPKAEDREIRHAYHRLASMYHPDRVSTLGEEFVRLAEERTKALNEAYAEIRKARGF